jgi:putative heme-binding domain-containing protein
MTLGSFQSPGDKLTRVMDRAQQIAVEGGADPALRLAAVNLLGRLFDRRAEDLETAGALLTPATPPDVQLAAVRAAARTERANVPTRLLAGWAGHSPAVRSAVADTLLSREPWALELAQSSSAKELDFSRRQRLLNHPSAKVKSAARTALTQAVMNADRQGVIDANKAALSLAGDRVRGQSLFGEHCATCHRAGQEKVGHDIGPNLLTVRDWPRENLLTAILDPDRTVEPRYLAYSVTLADGSALTGLVTAESANSVTLKTLDDVDHALPRGNLKSFVCTNHSLMPQGFEAALDAQALADLMSYIASP